MDKLNLSLAPSKDQGATILSSEAGKIGHGGEASAGRGS